MRDITLEDTIYMGFSTRAFATGVPTTLAGTPVVSAYENADLTEITAGITLGVDHDSRTGFHMLTIVATAANGYEDGKDYTLVITTGTVGGVSVVGEVVGEFTIGRSAAKTDLNNAIDGLGALKTLIDALNDVSTADVLTQVNAALDTAISELGVAVPTATPTLRTGLMLIYMGLRNKVTVTATNKKVHNDAGTVIASKGLSDDATTYTEAEMA